MQCPTCYGPVTEGDAFCGACGERLSSGGITTDADQRDKASVGAPAQEDLCRPSPVIAGSASEPCQPGGAHAPDPRQEPALEQTVVVRKQTQTLAYLVEKEGEQVGRVFRLESGTTNLGRDPRNQVILNDLLVSGFHLRIDGTPEGGLLLSDLRSSNGTALNGEQIFQPRELHENDHLRVGHTTLVLKLVE